MGKGHSLRLAAAIRSGPAPPFPWVLPMLRRAGAVPFGASVVCKAENTSRPVPTLMGRSQRPGWAPGSAALRTATSRRA